MTSGAVNRPGSWFRRVSGKHSKSAIFGCEPPQHSASGFR